MSTRTRNPRLPKSPVTAGSWIVEAGGTVEGGDGGTTPPLPESDAQAAPNILDATATVYLEGPNFGFQGLILLPTANPRYANLKRIDVVGTYPPGQSRVLASITSWAGSTVAYKAPVGPQVTSRQDWVLSYPCYNAVGTLTTGALTRNVTVNPVALSSVAAVEVGPRYQDENLGLHTVVGITPTLATPAFPQDVTLWLTFGDGIDVWQGWYTLLAPNQQIKIGEGRVLPDSGQAGVSLSDKNAGTIWIPTNPAYGTWTVKAVAGRINKGVTPASVGAVSSTFTVTPVGICIPNGITDARFLAKPMPTVALFDLSDDRTIIYSKYHPGTWCWAYYGIEFTTPSFLQDNSYWHSQMTVQKGYAQTGTGTVSGGTTFTSAAGTFLAAQVGFEIHVAGILTTIASFVSDSVITLATAQPNGAGKSFEIWNEAPDDEGVNEDPFLHYRGRRFFSSPQLQDLPNDAVQIITSHGANPANWTIPLDKNADDSVNIFREYRFRIYNVSRLGTDSSGSGGSGTHSLQNVAWGGQDHGTLIPVAPGHILDLRNANRFGLADALGGGNGLPIKVNLAPPLYTDIATNSASISISGDFVVGADGKLTQGVIDLAKSINFGSNPNGGPPFFSTNGNTLFTVNAIGVNYLIAGDALFTGDVTFARTGGGKVTINTTGIRLDDNLTAPTATVTITSGGFQAQQANNKLIANSSGIQLQTSIGTPTPYVNTLTMDTTSVQLFSASNSIVMTAASIVLTKSGVNAPVLTLNATGLTAAAGSYATTVTASKVELTGPGGHRVTTNVDGVTVYADATHYVEVLTTGINIVGGSFTAGAVNITTTQGVVLINNTTAGIQVSLGGSDTSRVASNVISIYSGSIGSELSPTTLLVGRFSSTNCGFNTNPGGGSGLVVGGAVRIDLNGAISGASLNVGGGSVTCGTLTVTTFSPANISVSGTTTTGTLNATGAIQVNGSECCNSSGIWTKGTQTVADVLAGRFGIHSVAFGVGTAATPVTFTTANGKTVTVIGGIITSVA